MPITGTTYPFTQENIDKITLTEGVYELLDNWGIIYIGHGDRMNSIKTHLLKHKRGDYGFCTRLAVKFRYEKCWSSSSKVEELLLEYKTKNGQLPKCNDRTF